MKSYVILIVLLVGIAAGVFAAVYGPDYLESVFPSLSKPAEGGIGGEVVAKRLERGKLLITVRAPEGAILVTFTKKVPEINLLVEKGDAVRLDIKGYRPFVTDPDINMVKKPEPTKTEPAPAKTAPAPAKAEPAPAKTEPAPVKTEPAPAKTEPAPAKPAEKEEPAAEKTAPVSNSTM